MRFISKNFVWVALCLTLVTAVAYRPALQAGFVWDDDDYVTENQTLRSLDGLRRIWFEVGAVPQYYPLVHTTFWAEYHLWGLNPAGYHAVNLLLHVLNALLVWLILRRLEVPGAVWAALVFALHPVEVESVAWITERKNVLSGFFYLSALLAYLRFAERERWKWYGLALGLFLCALLSKTVTCSLPAALLLLLWWKRGRLTWCDARALVPFFVVGAALGLLTVRMEQQHVGAEGAEWSFSIIERCLIAGRALWFYAGKLFWPDNLVFIYPRWRIDASVWWQYLFPAGAVAVLVMLWWRRERWGRGPLVAALFFAGTLAPALGFFNVYPMRFSFVADHFQYLAGLGLIVLACAGWAKVMRWLGPNGRPVGMTVGALALLALAGLTWQQSRTYRDLEKLWSDTIRLNPQAWIAHNNLGVILADRGHTTDAIAAYRAALAIKRDYAEAYNNLGVALVRQGKLTEGIAAYRAALQIRPNYPEAHNNLGVALGDQGDHAGAIAEHTTALQIRPTYAEAHNNLGVELADRGQTAEAIAAYRTALQIRPDYAEAYNNLGVSLVKLGQVADGIAAYHAAVKIKPRYAVAYNNLGTALVEQGQLAESVTAYRAAVQVKPDYAEAHCNLGDALLAQDLVREATVEYAAALKIKPDYPAARCNLGFALGRQGKISAAIAQYRETLRRQPDWPLALRRLAWMLATYQDAGIRNATEAVQLAERLCEITRHQQADALAVLAAAYAAAGRFTDAIQRAQQAVALATADKNETLAGRLQAHLQSYQAGRPLHE